jgi:hypothetical protein
MQFKMEVQYDKTTRKGKLIYGTPAKKDILKEDYDGTTELELSKLAVSKMQAYLGLNVTADSSVIKNFSYDSVFSELDITFTSGYTYRYHNVPSYVAQNLIHSTSWGAHYNANIKGKFVVTRVS